MQALKKRVRYEGLAREIAIKAHAGQFRHDKRTPYITHPEAVASRFKDDKKRSIALLHDVFEDSNFDFTSLIEMGIDFDIAKHVLILTHDKKNESYEDYIQLITKFPIAVEIKIADIEHNYPTSTKTARKKYDKALKILRWSIEK